MAVTEAQKRAVKFLSTPSARRATFEAEHITGILCISIHALREEGDPGTAAQHQRAAHFYPRPPRGGRLITALAMMM